MTFYTPGLNCPGYRVPGWNHGLRAFIWQESIKSRSAGRLLSDSFYSLISCHFRDNHEKVSVSGTLGGQPALWRYSEQVYE